MKTKAIKFPKLIKDLKGVEVFFLKNEAGQMTSNIKIVPLYEGKGSDRDEFRILYGVNLYPTNYKEYDFIYKGMLPKQHRYTENCAISYAYRATEDGGAEVTITATQ